MDENLRWFLMKHGDAEIFGPVTVNQLQQWAREAQISPLDKISTDQTHWSKAPMLPALEMDYLIELGPDQFYGPTTLGTVREFLESGEVSAEAILTNCRDGSEIAVKDVPELQKQEEEQPVRTSLRVSLQERIRELEEALLEERRGRQTAESRCEKLEARLAEIG